MNSKSELKRQCAQDPVGMTKKILELEQRVKVLTDAMQNAITRFGYLALHDDSMQNGVIPSVGANELEEALRRR